MKKERKPRGIKLGGRGRSWDLCSCGNENCDPAHSFLNPYPAQNKIQKRLREGLCMGCGKKECKCKSKS